MRDLHLSRQDPALPSARVRWAELPGRQRPSGVRVFLHGLGASSTHDFPEIATHPALAATGHRSLLVDLLGFGYSDRPTDFTYALEAHAATVAAVLDAEGVTGAEIVGHSLGGAVALALAASRPELVGALTLAESNLRAGGGAWSGRIAEWREEEFLGRGHEEFLASETDPGYLTTLRLSAPYALHRTAVGLVRGTSPQLAPLLAAFAGPKAFLVGELSRPYDEEEDAVGAGAQILTVPRSGHAMPLDNPTGLAETLARASALAHGTSPVRTSS